jgi:SAM-dependent methyltransferase
VVPPLSRRGRALDALRLVSLALLPVQGRVRTLYRALSSTNTLCREALYLNLGYWADGARNLDEAGAALADLVARAAGLGPGDRVLDAGCGFADHEAVWLARHAPRSLVALNISPEQLALAAARTRDPRVRFVEGDAARLPLRSGSVDVVLSVEAAFHFRSREAFFREAARVLRPGGRLTLADLASVDRRLALRDRIAGRIGRSFWQIPSANLYPARVYGEKLVAAGFADVTVRSIWHDVYPPFAAHARDRLEAPDVRARLNPVYRRMLAASLGARRTLDPEAMDYLLVRAVKPAGPPG